MTRKPIRVEAEKSVAAIGAVIADLRTQRRGE